MRPRTLGAFLASLSEVEAAAIVITELRVNRPAMRALWLLAERRTVAKRDPSGDPPGSCRVGGVLVVIDGQADENDRLRSDLRDAIRMNKGLIKQLNQTRKTTAEPKP